MTAMITPMRADGSVHYDEAARLSRWLCDHGSSALVVAGTTGEAPTLDDHEKTRLFTTVVSAVGDRVPVIANTGGNDTRHSVELSRKAASCGVHALMAVAPYYNKPPQAGLIAHFIAIADAGGLPVIVYNIPGRTGVNVLPQTIVAMSSHPAIVAVKESSGDVNQIAEMAAAVPAEFDVYCGDDYLALPAASVGARGVVSVVSHVAGDALRSMLRAFDEGDVERARHIHRSLLPLFRALFAVTSPIPVKAAMRSFGFDAGACRPPLCELTPEQEAAVAREIAVWKPVAVTGVSS
ncbi:MAG: 4-hydroxy-tetrahydrodipicolinate synthase [Candidatus Eremiobacter antarcticus]